MLITHVEKCDLQKDEPHSRNMISLDFASLLQKPDKDTLNRDVKFA